MRELLVAETYRSGADPSRVIVNAELKAGDEGADGLSPACVNTSTWLSNSDTCWQLKAGSAGQASRLRGEVIKKQPAKTLRARGRFVVVASAAVDGGKGAESRRAVLVKEAKRAHLPVKRIEVFTSEQLTTWINEHPAIAAALRGMPPGFSSLSEWKGHPAYRDPWVSSTSLDAKLLEVRRAIEFDIAKPVVHLHVYGRPGVGKTRFVLQACLEAPWSSWVLYVPQMGQADVTGLLAAASRAGVVRLVLVVDEVPADQVKALAAHAFAAPDRLRVISIGPNQSPDTVTIGPKACIADGHDLSVHEAQIVDTHLSPDGRALAVTVDVTTLSLDSYSSFMETVIVSAPAS